METDKSKLWHKEKAWDLFCMLSLVGIWPRYIEPHFLRTTKLALKIPGLPKDLDGLRIAQFSDLHLNSRMSDYFLNKVLDGIAKFSPDFIFFTGDFLCRSQLKEPVRLKELLRKMHAKYGCYAILGNHDYEKYVSITTDGHYDVMDKPMTDIGKGFQRLFSKPLKLSGKIADRTQEVNMHQPLIDLLQETPFILLHNESRLVPIKKSAINLCGLGDYMLGKTLPEIAFRNYDHQFPGIVLTHNPDSIKNLKGYPGDLILSGHTHGGQMDVPLFRNRFFVMEDLKLKKGLCSVDGRWVYVNRGLGGVTPLRWFASPELLLMTLRG